MSTRFILQSTLSAIANAIRGKTGKTDTINPADFSASIEGIKTPQHYIRGKWMLNATLASKETHVEQTINFTCNGSTCTKFLYYDEGTPTIELSVSDGTYLYPYNNAWASEDFRTFDFGDEYQECSAAFYELFFSNGEDIAEIGDASGQPIEVASEAEMTAVLTNATDDDIGKIYKYTGTTGTYENGALYVVEKNVTLITFTIDGTEYQADEGMTWVEWCESDYNTGGYFVYNTLVYQSTNIIVKLTIDNVIQTVEATDEIMSDGIYSNEVYSNGGAD